MQGHDDMTGATDVPFSSAPFDTPEDARLYIKAAGASSDDIADIGETALALAYLQMPDAGIHPYRAHLNKLREKAKARLANITAEKGEGVDSDVTALVETIHGEFGYYGDQQTYDSLENTNIMRIIDRKRGLPVALGVLYIMAADACGISCAGLNFPGHYLVRLQRAGDIRILDPFNGGREMNAAELRQLLKSVAGRNAELSNTYYETVTRRDTLVRLQNNLKTRLIECEDYEGALEIVDTIRMLAPHEPRTFLDEGVLAARTGEFNRAIMALQSYLMHASSPQERRQIEELIRDISQGMQ